MRRGPSLRQLSYNSAPLRFSDHRPVYATFDCTVSIVDERRRDVISSELYDRRKADLGDVTGGSVVDLDEEDDEDLIGFEPLEPGLPAASSDRQKWWLDNRQAARANISIPTTGRGGLPMALNPNRPTNPFPSTDEPDWVSVSRGSPGTISSLSSSPYEKVLIPPPPMSTASNASTSTVARRMAPMFDTARLPAQVGRLALLDDDQVSRRSMGSETQQQPPPPPPPRRRAVPGQQQSSAVLPPRPDSAASSQRSVSKDGGSKPPIAKKPSHLMGSSPVAVRSPVTQQQQQPPLPPRSEMSRKPVPAPTESLI